MDSKKRKSTAPGLERRVKARAEPEPDLDNLEDESIASATDSESDSSSGDEESGSESDASDNSDASDASDSSSQDSIDASKPSFGALAKAQASLPPPTTSSRRNRAAATKDDAANDNDSNSSASDSEAEREAALNAEYRPWLLRPNATSQTRSTKPPTHRSNKHAPQETTSKQPVSRKRLVVDVAGHTRVKARDPRFDSTIMSGAYSAPSSSSAQYSRNGSAARSRMSQDQDRTSAREEAVARKAYAFLDEYRDDEIKQLKSTIKSAEASAKKAARKKAAADAAAGNGAGDNNTSASKSQPQAPPQANPRELEKLKRTLMSMESRKSMQVARDREQNIIAEHRKREKELLSRGVKLNPYYLKKSEQKKRVLTERFEGMSEKQVDKVMARREKKVAGREKKRVMPEMERQGR